MAKRDSTQAITPCHTRQIKVTKTYYTPKKSKEGYGADNVPVPWIQVKGYWLQRAGFDINTPITIQVMEGCLVLIAGVTTQNIAGAPSISQKQLKSVRKLLLRLATVESAAGGFVVTAGQFTEEAKRFAEGRNIQLLDGADLRRWMGTYTSAPTAKEAFEIVRQALLGELPPTLSRSDAKFLVDSLLGHMRKLGWSEPWLFSEVIVPLLEVDRVTPDELSDIWMEELFLHLSELLNGEIASFSRSREGRVTEIAAYLLARSHFETQCKTIDGLLNSLKKARSNVQRPLASTLNWTKWDCSLEAAMWIYAFCRHVEHYMEESVKLPTKFNDLQQSSKSIAMVRTLDEWRYNGVDRGAFASFIEEVGEI